jgi:hypothetical protein
MIKDKLPLGTKVEFTAISLNCGTANLRKKVSKFSHPGTGIICGVRQFHEGEIRYCYENMPEFEATNTVDVYLVAISYACIVRVQPEDIIPAG